MAGYDKFGNLRPNAVGLVFRALLGYRATPTMLMCIAYCLYWMIVSSVMMWRYKQVVRLPIGCAIACDCLPTSDGYMPATNGQNVTVCEMFLAGHPLLKIWRSGG